MIRVRDLSFGYSGDEVLKQISFEAARGRCVGLLGANGSGKSTLLGLLGGLFSPVSGSICIQDLQSPGQEPAIRRQTGLLLQEAELQILGATAREDLDLSLRTRGCRDKGKALELAGRFGLLEVLDQPVQHLSGGQKRKLCLAAVLLKKPDVLLFDEPFSGLDYPSSQELRAILQENRKQGISQIIAAHDLEPLLGIVETCLILQQGRLVSAGEIADIRERLSEFGIRPIGRGFEP
ncbi:MAG: energy-coupling factor ABC transporter ATP-binding protein [Desulfohalobiaceae bacterium]|nr:energy-coupling factor ABC transporter ATP-binding protein [Desulfohalobiaceae bacterium]